MGNGSRCRTGGLKGAGGYLSVKLCCWGWIYSTLMAGEWRCLGFEYLLPSVLDAM